MEREREKEIYVIGHRNPDTDSVCSAIAYARLKNAIVKKIHDTGSSAGYQDFIIDDHYKDAVYVAAAAGQMNTETTFVLDYFHVAEPRYMNVIRTQVRDMRVAHPIGIRPDMSLRKAWETMRDQNHSTLAIIDDQGKFGGLISMSDLARSYMSVLNNQILAQARTPIRNIIETLHGTLVAGRDDICLTGGKLVVATSNVDVLEEFIQKDDLVILANRYEAQLCAIENHASCLIVCDGSKVSRTIRKMAAQNDCTVISTPFDTYTVTRSINQSIPVSHFMLGSGEGVIYFRDKEFVSEIKGIMMNQRFRDFPVVTDDDRYFGMISRRSLINMESKKVILVDHNEQAQAAEGVAEAEIIEIIDHHKLGTVETIQPVKVRSQPVGCTATIIYQMYQENAIDIPKDTAGILCAAIISDTLLFRSPTCTAEDEAAATALSKIADIDMELFAAEMFEAGSNLRKKSDSEIFYQDYKLFSAGEIHYGVGQVISMNSEELEDIQERILAYMESVRESRRLSMVLFMLTNVLTESTRLLFVGKEAKIYIETSFGMTPHDDYVDLKGVVSRKKQLIPRLMATLQQ